MTAALIAPLAAAAHHIKGPYIDWGAFSPFIVLAGGALVVLLVGLLPGRVSRERVVPLLAVITLLGAIAAEIAIFDHHATFPTTPRICVIAAVQNCHAAALAVDDLALSLDILCAIAAIAAVILSWRMCAPGEAGHGEYHALLLFSVFGMAILVSAQELITLFIGIEMLSIPLYVLCASEHRREGSLESGLKYLVIGSVGSATLVYGLAMVYGATGFTTFKGIGDAIVHGQLSGGGLGDPMLFGGLAMVVVGFAFKASIAPFHQWTPDVYEGAPTPITAFMATATKAAAMGIFLRFFDVAVISAQNTWAPVLAAVGAITIIVGNVGALGQTSMKRMLGYSGVAQAGYMLAGVIVGTQLGVQATVLYLFAYLFMNIAAFAAIVGVEDETGTDQLSAFAGLGRRRPWLAWPLTIAMLSLAGIPATVGFIGKFQLINALVGGDYTWYAIVLVIGSMISLGYYLRVVATMWMSAPSEAPAFVPGPGGLAPIAGGSPELEFGGSAAPSRPDTAVGGPNPEVTLVAAVFGATCIFFGIIPQPLFTFCAHAGNAITGLF